jgi:hypothetical protein
MDSEAEEERKGPRGILFSRRPTLEDFPTERNGLWLLKNRDFRNRANFEDRKCLAEQRKSFVAHPDAMFFLRISPQVSFSTAHEPRFRLIRDSESTRHAKIFLSHHLKHLIMPKEHREWQGSRTH